MPAVARSEPFRDQVCTLGICDGSGWILGPEDVARPCDCRAARQERSRMRGISSVIPPRYSGVSFDRPPISDMARDLKARQGVEAVKTYLGGLDRNLEKGAGLWLMGNTGTGKTSLAMLLAKEALDRGKSVAVYFAPKLLTRIRMTYQASDRESSYDELFRRLTSVDLLYIDDLGSERRTDWVVEQLYALVNERYEAERSILVTSNARWNSNLVKSLEDGQKALTDQIGIRTVSRLTEICADPIPLFGADRRVDFALSTAP